MLQDPIVMNVRRKIHEMATYSGAGSSTDAAPPPQPPFPPQPDLPTPTPPQPVSLPMEHTMEHTKHMDETSSDENSRMAAHIRKSLREDPDRWLEDHSSGSLGRTSGLAGDAERISAGVEARTPTKEETNSNEGIRLIARDGWMLYRRLDDHSSGPSRRTSGRAGDAEHISAKEEARTESFGSLPSLTSDSPRSQRDAYPVPPPPAAPLPPPEDGFTDEEQTSEYSDYVNDAASADTDMQTNDGSEAIFLQRAFVPGTRVNLNSRHLQEVASQRQAAAVRTVNREARLRTNDTIQVTDATGRVLSEEEIRMWGRVMQQNADHEARYQDIEARRRQMDTESNWSTNAVVNQ